MSVTIKDTYVKYSDVGQDVFAITFDFDSNESENGEQRIEVVVVSSGVVSPNFTRENNYSATPGNFVLQTATGDDIAIGNRFIKADQVRIGSPLAAGETVYIFRTTEITQEHEYREGDTYYSTNNERVADKSVQILQEEQFQLDRTLQFPRTFDPVGLNLDLPDPEANKVIQWNDTQDGLVNETPYNVQITETDTTPSTLDDAIVSGTAIDKQILNTGGDEQLQIGVDETQINHDNLNGFVLDEHVSHSSVSILAGPGLTGGGDLTATRTLSLDATTLNHDDLANIPANQHVDHALVSVDPGTGLAGGGTIDTTKTLQVDPNNAVAATPAAADFVLFHDIDEPGTDKTKKTTISDIGIVAGADGKDVRVTVADASSGFLDAKIDVVAPVTKTVTDTGGGVLKLDMGLDQTALAIKSTQVTDFVDFGTDPGATDSSPTYEVGSIWINTTDDKVWFCKDNTPTAAQWIEASGGGGTGGDRPTWKLTGALGVYSFFDGYWIPENTDVQTFAELSVGLLNTGSSGQTQVLIRRDGVSGPATAGPFTVPATGTVGVTAFPIAPTIDYVKGDFFWAEIIEAATGADELTLQLNNASGPAVSSVPIIGFNHEVAIGGALQTINDAMFVASPGDRILVRSHLDITDIVGAQIVALDDIYIEFGPAASIKRDPGTSVTAGLTISSNRVTLVNSRYEDWVTTTNGLVVSGKNCIIRSGRFNPASVDGYSDTGPNNSFDVMLEVS